MTNTPTIVKPQKLQRAKFVDSFFGEEASLGFTYDVLSLVVLRQRASSRRLDQRRRGGHEAQFQSKKRHGLW